MTMLMGNLSTTLKISATAAMLLSTLLLQSCAHRNHSSMASYRVVQNTPVTKSHHNPKKAAEINATLALEFLNRGETERAKKKLLKAKKLAPKDPAVWYSFGYFFEHTGEPALAKNSYLKAITLNRKKGASHNNYGTFLCRQKQYEPGIKQFKLAVADPEYLDVSGAYENAGVCALAIPDKTRAVAFFKKALDYNSNADVALINLASISYAEKHYPQARSYLIQLSYVVAPFPEALKLRAEVERHLGNKKESAKIMATLKEKFPDSGGKS